jgi:uncharacterized phiE125 gp8 family phage protein
MSLDTVNAIVSLAEAKAFLKITGAGDDSIIESMINRASIWANDYTGRLLLSRTNTEYYDGDGTGTLILRQYPVTSITNIYDDVDRAFGSNTIIPAADIVLNQENGIVRLFNGSVAFTPGMLNVKAVYVAGYATPPESLKEAVLVCVGNFYRRQYADQKFGIVSESTGDRTTSYANEDFPARAKSLLNPYRSERVFLGV